METLNHPIFLYSVIFWVVFYCLGLVFRKFYEMNKFMEDLFYHRFERDYLNEKFEEYRDRNEHKSFTEYFFVSKDWKIKFTIIVVCSYIFIKIILFFLLEFNII